MEQKKRLSRGEWEQLVGEQAKSGSSAKRFCEERSIGLASFYQWRSRIVGSGTKSKNKVQSAGTFIDMGKMNTGKAPVETEAGGWNVTLNLGGGLKLELRRT